MEKELGKFIFSGTSERFQIISLARAERKVWLFYIWFGSSSTPGQISVSFLCVTVSRAVFFFWITICALKFKTITKLVLHGVAVYLKATILETLVRSTAVSPKAAKAPS